MRQASKIDEIYRTTPLETIPWIRKALPEPLIRLIHKKKISACKTIDVGCGTGTDAVGLAMMGFDVIGIDISPAAIRIADENIKCKIMEEKLSDRFLKRKINCNFVAADALNYLGEVVEAFDFVYDKGLLHMLSPGDKKVYVKNAYKILTENGRYFSGCFIDDKNASFDEARKAQKWGQLLYVPTISKLIDLFNPYFDIIELETEESKSGLASYFTWVFMKKR